MTSNLFLETWSNLDSHELRLLLHERIGGPGQYDDYVINPKDWHLPLAGTICRIIVGFKNKKINFIKPGSAFDAQKWKETSDEIDKQLNIGDQAIGREFSFSGTPVIGFWRGTRSGLQICPPPPSAPRPDQILGENPFILEFPISRSSNSTINNHRRIRQHQRYTRVLNLLINRRICFQRQRRDHFWAQVPVKDGPLEYKFLHNFYFAHIGEIFADALTPATDKPIEVVNADKYNLPETFTGDVLSIPDDLDELLRLYQNLSTENQEKFDRAAFWFDLASQQWKISASASFISLISAIEAFVDRGNIHKSSCGVCGSEIEHEVPGATKRFVAFLEEHAHGQELKKHRDKMYGLRSGISHGSDLFMLDQNRDFGWDPPGSNELDLHRSLWRIVKTATRNWLKSSVEID